MAAQYKLTYFDARGIAEPIRWIFVQAGQEYEDFRLKDFDEWRTIKPNTPLGQVPILEVHGKQISQSKAIARYLASKFGLTGKNDWDRGQEDMIVDYVEDLRKPVLLMKKETNEEEKSIMSEKYVNDQRPVILANFEKILKGNGGGNGFFVGNKVSWCDLYFAAAVNSMFILGEECGFASQALDNFDKLKTLVRRVEELPAISKWLHERPATER